MNKFVDGKFLDINLTTGEILTGTLPAETFRLYPGGSALGMYFLLKEMDPKADALGPENLLIFSVSPLTGMPISGQSRMCVTTKSPLTGGAGDSQVGGFIPAQLKANGYDSVIFRGKSEKPVYLYIDGETVALKDASAIWGKVTGEAEDFIRAELEGEKVEISLIGPAGENLSKMAAIIHRKNRANGRNGVGAVMGSKNLKALVVKNQRPRKPICGDLMKGLTFGVKDKIQANAGIEDMAINGTAGTVDVHQAEGFLPSRNWSSGRMEDCEPIFGTTIAKTVLKERDTCYACAIRCKATVEIKGKVDPQYGGPEYETCATFGSYCGNNNLESICYANQLCNMYGLDTISCGATIAFAMDCYEKGILTQSETDGLALHFGNETVFETLIHKMTYREEGIGALLADGSACAAEKIGKGSQDLVVACKRQEAPAHMVQMKGNLAIHYAVNPYGADHQSVEHDPVLMSPDDSEDWKRISMLGAFEKIQAYGILDDNKAKYSFATQKFYSMLDTLCLCQFAWGPAWQLYGPLELLQFIEAATGYVATVAELQEIGERRLNLMRQFNAKAGFDKKDDVLPKKMFLPIPEGPGQGVAISQESFDRGISKYYEIAGWDATTGNPTVETLERLQLGWAV